MSRQILILNVCSIIKCLDRDSDHVFICLKCLEKEDEEELNREVMSLDLSRIKHPLNHSWTFW